MHKAIGVCMRVSSCKSVCRRVIAAGFTWKQEHSWMCAQLVWTPKPYTGLHWSASSQHIERTDCLDPSLWSQDLMPLGLLKDPTMSFDLNIEADTYMN